MTVTEHTRITAGENLALTCTLTNILSDPTALVWWSNRGKNITGSAVTPAYTKGMLFILTSYTLCNLTFLNLTSQLSRVVSRTFKN